MAPRGELYDWARLFLAVREYRMRVLPSGEAMTDQDCVLCGRPHRVLGEDDRVAFAEAGFTTDELDAIDEQFRQQYGHGAETVVGSADSPKIGGSTGGTGAASPAEKIALRRKQIREAVARHRAKAAR